MQRAFFMAVCLLLGHQVLAQLPVVSAGGLQRFENFPSRYVTARNVEVWLPDGYSKNEKYAVLYMHDGQMLFDSSITWTRQEWGADETMGRLLKEQKIKNCIIVGIWNSGIGRWPDYFPQKPFEMLPQQVQDSLYFSSKNNGTSLFSGKKIQSDQYLRFIVSELKPFIDSNFSVYTDLENTFISGSSMGGLISLYAICEYPEVFGGAACLSTHWPGTFSMDHNPIPAMVFRYLKKKLPSPLSHRIYFDYGDKTLDSLYPPLQKKADEIMKERGYTSKNWSTRFFPGEDHSEMAWKKRLDTPLLFLLKKVIK